MAGQLDIKIHAGAWFERLLTYKVGGVVVNLTGYAAKLSVFDDKGALVAEILSTNTSENATGYITLDASGNITLYVTQAKTAELSGWRMGFYVLELTPPSGRTKRLLDGTVNLIPRTKK